MAQVGKANKRGWYLHSLHSKIVASFSLEDLRTLMFPLSIELDDLPGSERPSKIFSLIQHLARRGRLSELLSLLREARPREEWPELPSAEQQIEDQKYLSITEDQREQYFRQYVIDMQDLLLHHNLRNSKSGDVVQIIARTQTLAALRNLDGQRKSQVIRFLYEAELVQQSNIIVVLNEADLSDAVLSAYPMEIDLSDIVLYKVNLSRANLSQTLLRRAFLNSSDLTHAELTGSLLSDARLSDAILYYADLRVAVMMKTDFSFARLNYADLRRASMNEANLRNSFLQFADLRYADLSSADQTSIINATNKGADLSSANLFKADLRGARLNGVDFRGANLEGANLSQAQMIGTRISKEQLRQAKSLDDATIIIDEDYKTWIEKPDKELYGTWVKNRLQATRE